MTVYYAKSAALGGSESGNGLSYATAKLYPQSAMNLASAPGDEVALAGILPTGIDCAGKNGALGNPITIRPYTSSTYSFLGAGIGVSFSSHITIVDPGSDNRGDGKDTQNSIYGTSCHHITVQGFNFVGGGAGNGIIMFTQGLGLVRDITLLDGVVSYSNFNNYGPTDASHGVYFSGGYTQAAATAANGVDLNILVSGVEAHHCDDKTFAYGIQCYTDNAYNNRLNGITIHRCKLHHNSHGCVLGWGQMTGTQKFINNWVYLNTQSGLHIDNCVNPLVLQNSFYSNNINIECGALAYCNGADIRNNICSGGNYGVIVWNTSSQSHVNARFNNFNTTTEVQDYNVLTFPSVVSSNDHRDPKFVDPANGDLSLQSSSLERGVCLTITSAPVDRNNVTRAVSGTCDRGAAEFVTSSAPVITSPITAVSPATFAFHYQITATNSPTSYGATGLPAGLSINTSTGEITGNPSIAGISAVTLSATNASGTDTQDLTITIEALAPVIMVLA